MSWGEPDIDWEIDWDDDEDLYEDPPLYPAGKLAGMTVDQLQAEHDRQCDWQGALGDADHIDDRAVEETEMRCRMVQAEIDRRKAPLSEPGPTAARKEP